MVIVEPLINNSKALQNITDDNPLNQNDDECGHQIIILITFG